MNSRLWNSRGASSRTRYHAVSRTITRAPDTRGDPPRVAQVMDLTFTTDRALRPHDAPLHIWRHEIAHPIGRKPNHAHGSTCGEPRPMGGSHLQSRRARVSTTG